MSERNPIGAGRGDLMPSAKTKLGDGYYIEDTGIPATSPATNSGGTDVHEWASVHVIFYADDTDYTNLYLTVRPWRWYPTAREGHGPTDPQGRWIPDKIVEVALDPDQTTTIRGSHYAWPTRDAERMFWQIVSCVDVGATTNEPNWVVIQPYGLSRTDALEVLATSGDGGGGGGGSSTAAIIIDDSAFAPRVDSVSMSGFTFDDAAPDSVDEGDGGAARMSGNRNIYTTLRDAAGNERGANIDATNRLTVVDAAAVVLLGTIDADTGIIAGDTTSLDAKQPALGTAAMIASSPVTIASDDTLTVAANALLATLVAASGQNATTYLTGTDAAFVVGDSPVTIDVNAGLGMNGNKGWLTNDGAGDFTLAISKVGTPTYGGEITLKNGETFSFDGLDVDQFRITWVADSAYRYFIQ